MRSLSTHTSITRQPRSTPSTLFLHLDTPTPLNQRARNMLSGLSSELGRAVIGIHIQSETTFRRRQLAFSASGYAVMAKALCTLHGIADAGAISSVERIGSGSARAHCMSDS